MKWVKNLCEKLKDNWFWILFCTLVVIVLGSFLYVQFLHGTGPYPFRHFQVDGIKYHISADDRGKKLLFTKVEVAGYITSYTADYNAIEQDNQASFDCVGAPYAIIKGNMMIKLHGKWYTGIPQTGQ